MFSFKKVLASFLAVTMLGLFMLLLAPFSPSKAQTLPPYNKIMVTSVGEFHGTTLSSLFNFVTNMQNDEKWWDGVESTELVAGSLNGPFAGREFLQHGSFNGFPYVTEIHVTGGYQNVYMSLEASSPFLTYKSAYFFTQKSNGNVLLTSVSVVEGYGVTPELMDSTIHAAFTKLAGYLGLDLVHYTNVLGIYLQQGS